MIAVPFTIYPCFLRCNKTTILTQKWLNLTLLFLCKLQTQTCRNISQSYNYPRSSTGFNTIHPQERHTFSLLIGHVLTRYLLSIKWKCRLDLLRRTWNWSIKNKETKQGSQQDRRGSLHSWHSTGCSHN